MKRFACMLALSACALTPGCFSLDEDGDGLIDIPPESGSEVNAITCADGRDNDYDSRIDCEDSDCLMGAFCGEEVPLVPRTGPENNPDTCTDGIDNDEDGQFDCGDRSCQGIMELCCVTEVDNRSCSNRFDDDGNGYADCTDFSCRNNRFVSVCESELQCVKLDENGNTLPCTSEEEAAAAEVQCQDRFDNDGDRRTDCNDDECACTEACNPGCPGAETTVENCQDGFDNDGNGYIDCADHSCSMSTDQEVADLCASGTGGQESTLEQCTNGNDDDEDNYADCADFSCSNVEDGASMEAAEHCASRAENTLERCKDGIDNDGNGHVDCDDFSCSRSDDEEVADYCRSISEATFEACGDNLDNDGNGFTDCRDRGCQFMQISYNGFCSSDAECPAGQSCYRGSCLGFRSPCFEGGWIDDTQTIRGNEGGGIPTDSTLEEQIRMAVAGCTDGADNDGDGFTDCEDWECNHNPRVIDLTTGELICSDAAGAPLVCR